MKKILAIITLVFLTNCSYKPLINPETSRDKWTGESIAGDYYKDLQACNYIWERETKYKLPFEKADMKFITKCMNDYGYSILR